MKPYKTTDAHMKLFEAECEKWIVKLSMSSWRRTYRHEDSEHAPKCAAWCSVDIKSHALTLGLTRTWNHNRPTPARMKVNALHEVLEGLLWTLGDAGLSPTGAATAFVERETHVVIRSLENLLVGGVW